MTIDFNAQVTIPEDVLMRELDGESILLNLASDSYFGLDRVGTDMWRALTTTGCLQEAYEALLAEYDVEPDVLRRDMEELVQKLVNRGLMAIADSATAAARG
jgi:hypothetical protein